MIEKEDLANLKRFMDECSVGIFSEEGIELVNGVDTTLEFYPIGEIQVLLENMIEINSDQFDKNLNHLLREASRYGGVPINEQECSAISSIMNKGFSNPKYYTNFSGNSWSPVTKFSRDSILCVLEGRKSNAIISFDDE